MGEFFVILDFFDLYDINRLLRPRIAGTLALQFSTEL